MRIVYRDTTVDVVGSNAVAVVTGDVAAVAVVDPQVVPDVGNRDAVIGTGDRAINVVDRESSWTSRTRMPSSCPVISPSQL